MIQNIVGNKNLPLILGLIVLVVLFATGHGVSVSVGAPNGGAPVDVTPPEQNAQQGDATPAEENADQEAATDWLWSLLAAVPAVISVGSLGGWTGGGLDLLKMTGLATRFDGQSGKFAIVVNLVIFLAVSFANLFGMGDKVKDLIEQFGLALPTIVVLLTMFKASDIVHWALKQIQPVAFSLSKQVTNRAVKEMVAS